MVLRMQQISDCRELALRSSHDRGEWLGKARVQMRNNGQASKSGTGEIATRGTEGTKALEQCAS